MIVLETDEINVGYGEVDVLHRVSLEVDEGELTAVVGPNGAGKTTLLRAIAGVLTPTAGTIHLNSENITGSPPEEILRMGLSYVPQDEHIFPSLSVQENLEMGAYTMESSPEDRIKEVCTIFPQLESRMDQKAGSLSGGQQQMVAVGRGLIIQPEVLLLDEPTAGLQPSLVEMMLNKVEEINRLGVSVLLVAQTIDALELSERAYLLTAGEIALSGSTDDLLHRDKVQQLYFGGS